jgi:hypothetical protein
VTECGQQPAIAELTSCTADAHVRTETAPGTWLISSPVINPIFIHYGYLAEFAGIKASITLHVINFQFRCYWDNHISNTGVESRSSTRSARLERHGSGQAISITYSECVFVAVVVQHANRMRRVTLPSVPSPAL